MEFPACIVTASPIPGCQIKALFLLLWPTKGDDRYSLLMFRPCSFGSKVSRKTHLLVLGTGLAGFSPCHPLREGCGGGGERVDFLLSLPVEGLIFPVF